MIDLVLARPGLSHSAENYWSTNLPLGLGYLASSALQKGLSVQVVDGKILGHQNMDNTIEAIVSHQPKFVGLSSITVDFPLAVKISERIKQKEPSVKIVLGGPHSNALPVQSLEEAASIDYVLTGQCEFTLVQLIKAQKHHQSIHHIPGLYYRDTNGVIKGNADQLPESDLGSLPFPAWHLFPKTEVYPVMTARGCPFKCVFCSHNMSYVVKSRRTEEVLAEIKWLAKEHGAKVISFEDETFGLLPKRTNRLLNELIRYNTNSPKIAFAAQTRVNCVTHTLARLMKQAGFEFISLGVESGDQEVLNNAKKNITLMQVREAVSIARKAGLKISLKFIIGLPGDTFRTVRKTIKLATELNPEVFSTASIVAYPGSKIYQWAINNQNGYRLTSTKWEDFDKYLHPSVELETLPLYLMKWLQIQMVLEVYIRNFRFRELWCLIKRHSSAIPLTLYNLIKTMFQRLLRNYLYFQS